MSTPLKLQVGNIPAVSAGGSSFHRPRTCHPAVLPVFSLLPGSALTALAGDATSQCQLFARGIRGAICWFNSGTLVLLRTGQHPQSLYYQTD